MLRVLDMTNKISFSLLTINKVICLGSSLIINNSTKSVLIILIEEQMILYVQYKMSI